MRARTPARRGTDAPRLRTRRTPACAAVDHRAARALAPESPARPTRRRRSVVERRRGHRAPGCRGAPTPTASRRAAATIKIEVATGVARGSARRSSGKKNEWPEQPPRQVQQDARGVLSAGSRPERESRAAIARRRRRDRGASDGEGPIFSASSRVHSRRDFAGRAEIVGRASLRSESESRE